MYTEILKIIEGGLNKDPKKVVSYSKMLAENLAKEGDLKGSQRIMRALEGHQSAPVYMDQLLISPIDQETRLNMVDMVMPRKDNEIKYIISETLSNKLDGFVSRLQHREALQNAGIESIASLLLYGPPGCGKTTLAHYIAQKLELPLVIVRLDALVSSLLGSTAKNIRKVFEFASRQPCILFLDEFDAIAKARDDQHELGELKRVVNSLLQNIDEFIKSNVLIAATNHEELLDKAIWRRFNSVVEVGLPAEKEIRDLLILYLSRGNAEFNQHSKKWENAVELLKGISPADIKSISQNAIAQAVMNKKDSVTYPDFLLQYYYFKHHSSSTAKDLVEFLNRFDVGQRVIAELTGISDRQVRNYLSSN